MDFPESTETLQYYLYLHNFTAINARKYVGSIVCLYLNGFFIRIRFPFCVLFYLNGTYSLASTPVNLTRATRMSTRSMVAAAATAVVFE